MAEMDRLELEIQAQATKANAELDKLVGKLERVSSALVKVDTTGLKGLADGVDRFSSSMREMSNVKTADFTRLAKNIDKLGSINQSGINSTSQAIKSISSSLRNVNTSGFQGLSNGVDKLSKSMQVMNSVKTTDFTRLARNIGKLGEVNQAGINSTASALKTISTALTASTGLSSGAAQITELASSISKLGYKSASTAITNIPLMATALKELMRTLSSSPQVSKNLIEMTNAIATLAREGSKVRSATNGINSSLKNYSNSAKQASNSTRGFTFSLAGLYAKIWAVRRGVSGLWKSVEKSMDFVETINLFQTSFKKIGVDTAGRMGMEMGSVASENFAIGFIDRAEKFNKKLTDSLILDPDLMMNYQAVFAQMSHSMNLTADSAMNISEAFTLLGNDIASLWNVETDSAMKKLQSGLAGQIRPLRELGIDISKTSLEMYALNYGIKDSVEKMSQASKVQLRWLAIMEQAEVAFGDMAKTIDSPANQIRVLRQQWDALSRTIGSVFLPIVTKILPYINAVVIVLRRMISTLALAVGFELPDYKDDNIYSSVIEDIDVIGESADETTNKLKKLQKIIMGFDELNILSSSNGGTGNKGAGLGAGSGYPALDDAIARKTESYMNKFNEELAKMKNTAEGLADKIQPKIEKFIKWINKISPALKGVAAAFVTYKVLTWFADLAKAIARLSMSPLGVIAIAVGALVFLYDAIKKYNKKILEENLAKRFGDIVLSLEEVESIAKELTTNKYTFGLELYMTEKTKLKDIQSDIEENIKTLNKLNWKVSVGLGLTEGEVASYKSTIESFITNSEAYLEQQQYVANLAISATISDADFSAEMQSLVNGFYDTNRKKFDKLGKKLRKTVDEALADGILDAEEQKVIMNLTKEMNDIVRKVSEAEFKAKMQVLAEGDISRKSFEEISKKIDEEVEAQLEKAKEAQYSTLVSINLAYQAQMDEAKTQKEKDKIKKEWNASINKAGEEIGKQERVIKLSGYKFKTDKGKELFKKELKQMADIFDLDFTQQIHEGMVKGGEDWDKALQESILKVSGTLQTDMSKMDKTSRKAAAKVFESMKPTHAENLAIARECLASGKKVPQNVADGISDAVEIGALAGDADSINYMLGKKFSTDPTFLEVLAKSKTGGKDIDKSMLAGLKSGIPDLKIQGDKVVFDLGKAITKASNQVAKKDATSGAKSIISSYANTIKNDKSIANAIKTPLQSMNSLVSAWKLPKLKLDFETGNVENPFSKYFPKTDTIPKFASGGFPNTGEMFIAKEAGPELVGRIGNRTAVANTDQITGGIAAAVEGALVNVLVPFMASTSGNSGGGDIVVENRMVVDSEILYNLTQKGKQKSDRRYQTTTVLG